MINNYIKINIFFPLILFLGCNNTINITSQESIALSPQVTLSASQTSISVGETSLLDVNIADIENLYAISFEILIDPIYLDVLDMQLGFNDYIDDSTNGNIGPIYYSEEGKLSFAFSGNNINGKIFSFTVQGIHFGTTDVELNSVNLIQYNGENVSNYSAISFENINLIISE